MREILFRGKRVDNGEWVEGYYFHDIDKRIVTTEADYIIGFADKDDTTMQNIEVVPETVGQYTGLTDKNGKKIFEGDMVKARPSLSESPYLVSFAYGGFMIKSKYGNVITPTQEYIDIFNAEVIGNIYDNPELLEDK